MPIYYYFQKISPTRKRTHGLKNKIENVPNADCCWGPTGKYVDVQEAYVDHRHQGNPERMSPE